MPNEPKNQSENNIQALNPIARHNARRYALQAMYQWQVAKTSITEIEAEFVRYHIDKPLESEYFKELIYGIPQHQTEIDEQIKPFLNRCLSEIDPVELSVLRLATYELLKRPDVPYPVIINEALELTKKFGSIEGYKFVNGVLDRIAKKIREVETKMGRK